MDGEAAARAWIDGWTRAWRALDAELLTPVYTADAVHRSHPYREPQHPLDYARWAFAEEEGEPQVWMGEPLVEGERAAVEWWACMIENGKPVSYAGHLVASIRRRRTRHRAARLLGRSARPSSALGRLGNLT